MSSVVENILNRKGKVAPFSDNKKIALVLYGGIMSGVVGTGATTALEELGLTHAFDYIFCFSAGFPNASYFLAHQAPLSSSVYINDLSGLKFINPFKLWSITNIDHLIHVLKDVKPLRVEEIFKSKTKIILRIKDMREGEFKYIEIDESYKDNYFKLLKASVKMAHLSPGAVRVGENIFMDGGGYEKDFLQHISEQKNITDVCIVYCRPNKVQHANFHGKNVLELVPPMAMSGTDARHSILLKACEQMKEYVKREFTVHKNFVSEPVDPQIISSQIFES